MFKVDGDFSDQFDSNEHVLPETEKHSTKICNLGYLFYFKGQRSLLQPTGA
jgi:hypothetical protein